MRFFGGSLLVLMLSATSLFGDEPAAMNAQETALSKSLSGAVMSGFFSVDRDDDAPPELRRERYELGEVKKLDSGMWVFPTRIKYGDHDVTLPIVLPVAWADDTAVIRVNNIGFPGLGTYSARVLIHDGKYAGYWQGAGHGGRLFGSIKKDGHEEAQESTKTR
ncbi:hypothetical protein Pla175_00190 [Pirellulimonas nuda]|uniref:Uncharacterized protein n=1 Tax=Pirellulimonas nuda TaxID=2528009 RepID=A0A518D5D4_9BACT|nr:hypothetical protein [Pirellulimonas nuda]QDU86669.1 hypothetical protein Pla175_00190 [Pirellulimonas nuda]